MLSKVLGLVALLALCGCSTLQDDLTNDREGMIASCVRQVQVASARFKAHAMAYTGLTRERLPQGLCDRLAVGVDEGRITQRDLNQLIRTGQLTSRFAFLKG